MCLNISLIHKNASVKNPSLAMNLMAMLSLEIQASQRMPRGGNLLQKDQSTKNQIMSTGKLHKQCFFEFICQILAQEGTSGSQAFL